MENQKRKYFWIVFNSAFVLFMVKLDAYIVNVSLPTIARSFGLDLAEASYVVVAYLLFLTNTMLIFGKLEDRIGVKKLLVCGYALFTLGSLFCGLSPTITALVLSRVFQGIGGAMMLICGFGVINKFLPKEIEGWGLGIVTTAAALGLATGAPLGGYITHFLSWRWIFLVNVPLGVLGIFITIKTVASEKQPENGVVQRFDFLGAVLSFVGLSCITYVLSDGGKAGWFSSQTIITFLISILILVIFVIWETKCAYPLLELRIFKNRGFTYGNIALFFIFMLLSGADFIIPFFLELAKQLDPSQVGFFMFLYSVAYSLAAPSAGKLTDKPGLGAPISLVAMLIVAVLFFVYAFTLQLPGVIYTIIFFAFWGIGNAFFIPENFRLIFVNTPQAQKGAGTGVFNIVNNLSMVFGVCAFQIIFSHMTHSADIPTPEMIGKGIWTKEVIFHTFRNIFIFTGLLYIATAVFSAVAEKVPVEKSKERGY